MIYAAITVFLFPPKFLKNGQLVPSYAFPCYITGTSLLFIGMLYSAFMIDRSSEEYRFKPRFPSTVYWLQPGNQNVGDQVFHSFLAEKDLPGLSAKREMVYIKSTRVRKYDGRHPEIYLSVMSTISGFIIQFIGLRGLHASVILAQLGSTLAMSIIRTCLRAERLAPDENMMRDVRDVVSDKKQELDCLACHIEHVGSFNLINPLAAESPSSNSSFDSSRKSGPSLLEKLISTRTRLAELTSSSQNGRHAWDNLPINIRAPTRAGTQRPVWDTSPIRIIAQTLAETIDSTMELLSSWNIEFEHGFQFELPLECTPASSKLGQPLHESYTIKVQKSLDFPKWKVNEKELEAIIGLWTWTLYKSDNTWKTTPHEQPISRVVGLSESEAGKEATYRYFHKWIFRQTEPRMISAKFVDIPRRLFAVDTEWHGDERYDRDALAIDTRNELEVMVAQDLYIQFLRHAIDSLKSFDLTVDLIPGLQNSYVAQNSTIDKLVDCFENNGLGSREDALLCIIPVLKQQNKLPYLTADCRNVRKRTEDFIKANDWKKAFQLVEWISQRSDGVEMEYALHELGSLCRKALLAQDPAAQEVGLEYLYKILNQDLRYEFLRTQGMNYPLSWSAPPEYQLRWQSLQRELGWVAQQISNNVSGMTALKTGHGSIYVSRTDRDLEELGTMDQNSSDPAVGHRTMKLWLTLDRNEFLTDYSGEEDVHAYRWALTRGNFVLLYFVLVRWVELGADVPDLVQHAYVVAARNQSTWGIQVLQRRGADINMVNSRKVSALVEVILNGDLDAVQTLLTMGARVNGDDDIPNARPLINAAQCGFTGILELLLNHGAMVDAVDSLGMSSLYWACSHGHVDAVRLLASRGASLSLRGTGKKPIHYAVKADNMEMAQLILDLGVDINEPEEDSKHTALMIATLGRHSAMMQFLLEKGADIQARDEQGLTVLEWARREELAEPIAILESWNRRPATATVMTPSTKASLSN